MGWIRRFLGPLYFTGVFWFRIHRFGVRLLPYWLMLPLMVPFVAFFSTVLRNIRAAVASNVLKVSSYASLAGGVLVGRTAD